MTGPSDGRRALSARRSVCPTSTSPRRRVVSGATLRRGRAEGSLWASSNLDAAGSTCRFASRRASSAFFTLSMGFLRLDVHPRSPVRGPQRPVLGSLHGHRLVQTSRSSSSPVTAAVAASRTTRASIPPTLAGEVLRICVCHAVSCATRSEMAVSPFFSSNASSPAKRWGPANPRITSSRTSPSPLVLPVREFRDPTRRRRLSSPRRRARRAQNVATPGRFVALRGEKHRRHDRRTSRSVRGREDRPAGPGRAATAGCTRDGESAAAREGRAGRASRARVGRRGDPTPGRRVRRARPRRGHRRVHPVGCRDRIEPR
jgi:hypothetical protein